MVLTSWANGSWNQVLDLARATVNKPPADASKEVSIKFRKSILLAEHSPIRVLNFGLILSLKSWISVHFVRHKIGVEHFVTTQRDDRTGIPRDEKPQAAPVKHSMFLNAQALITISRKRLCFNAHPETRKEWVDVKRSVATIDPEVASVMVAECIYRGFCPEMSKCKEKFDENPKFKRDLEAYRANAGWKK